MDIDVSSQLIDLFVLTNLVDRALKDSREISQARSSQLQHGISKLVRAISDTSIVLGLIHPTTEAHPIIDDENLLVISKEERANWTLVKGTDGIKHECKSTGLSQRKQMSIAQVS
jgi:hypothetical protein